MASIAELAPRNMQEVRALAAQFVADAKNYLPEAELAARTVELWDEDDADSVAERLNAFKLFVKALNEKRLTITRPLDQAKKAVMEMFEEGLAPAERAIEILTGAVRRYSALERQRAAAAEAEARKIAKEHAAVLEQKAQLALEAGDQDTARALQTMAATVPVVPTVAAHVPAGISVRDVFKWEVVDAAAVPREFLCIDEAKVSAHVRAHAGETNIPGIRVYPDTIPARKA